jgi:alginate O-acetyltransferase complex protein AlgJ
MGWGESAGFAEHLSLHLGRDVDVIAVNDNGASATRQALARDLARGKDRLAGKKLVVWEFAARELAVGDWKPVELTLGAPPAAAGKFVAPEPGQTIVVTGTVESRSAVPRPGTVPYKDQVFAVHLTDVERDGTLIPGGQAVVYLRGMRDNAWTPAARLRVGQRVKMKLTNWSDVAARYERMNRSELPDESLQFETPAWGEVVE